MYNFHIGIIAKLVLLETCTQRKEGLVFVQILKVLLRVENGWEVRILVWVVIYLDWRDSKFVECGLQRLILMNFQIFETTES